MPPGWLNDGVKGFVSSRHEITTANLPQHSHLQLSMPSAQYLLAMKCLASRIAAGSGEADDTSDILFLTRHLGLHSPQEVLDVLLRFFPEDRIPIRAKFLVESLFEEGRL